MTTETVREQVARNLELVQQKISTAAGRRSITLVCVTKYAKDEWARGLVEAGAHHLGENLLPRGADKFREFAATGLKFTRHLIGPQQSRKARQIAAEFDWFQAVDRVKIAGMLHSDLRERGSSLNALLQVNISGEGQKHGIRPEECPEVFSEIRERFDHVRLRGLMAIPAGPQEFDSNSAYETATRRSFQSMRVLFDKIARLNPGAPAVDTLSLGMTQDFVWAIEEGTTMVRIGSALFEGLEG